MGMYDSFWSNEPDEKCPSGHPLDGEFQTKRLDCALKNYKVGDYLDLDDWDFEETSIWVYTWCKPCDKLVGRWASIVANKFVGFNSKVLYEEDSGRKW